MTPIVQPEDLESNRPIPPLFQTLVDLAIQPRIFQADYQATVGGKPVSPLSLIDSLGINSELLSPIAQETLTALESKAQEEDTAQWAWTDFRWKLTAFLYLQDIFDAPLYEGGDI